MKRTIAWLLALCMCLGLVGCSKDQSDTETTSTTTEAVLSDTKAPSEEDDSFEDEEVFDEENFEEGTFLEGEEDFSEDDTGEGNFIEGEEDFFEDDSYASDGSEIGAVVEDMNGELTDTEKEAIHAYFEKPPVTSFDYDFSKYDEVLKTMQDGNDELGVQANAAAALAVPLPEQYSSIIQDANQMLITFFSENYNISVEEELAALRTEVCDLPENILGMYCMESEGFNDGKVFYLDSGLVEDYDAIAGDPTSASYDARMTEWKSVFLGTYLHEVIHYLGSVVEAENYLYVYFIEGITQSLAEQVMEANNCPVYNYSYAVNTSLASQLLTVDKDIVVTLIEGSGYSDVPNMDSYFDTKSFAGMYDALTVSATLAGNDMDSDEYAQMAQAIMTEYLKHYNLTRDQMLEIYEHFYIDILSLT